MTLAWSLKTESSEGAAAATPQLHKPLLWATASLAEEEFRLNLTKFVFTWSYFFLVKEQGSKPAWIQKLLWSHTWAQSHQSCTPTTSNCSSPPAKTAHVGNKPQHSHSCRSHAAEDRKRKQARAPACKTKKVHSFERSACKNWMEKRWRHQHLRRSGSSSAWAEMLCVSVAFNTSLQQRHQGMLPVLAHSFQQNSPS